MVGRRHWPLRDKVILLTGGAGGIGAATATELHQRGARLVLVDVDEAALTATAARIGDDVQTVVTDVTDREACRRAVAAAVERFGRLDLVWANAGIGAGGPVELIDPAAWTRVIEVNLVGAFNTVAAALPEVIRTRGHVAITASLASFAHAPGMSAYAASKAGVEAFADSLRIEVAHQGVTVATLHPTWIDTEMVREGDAESEAFARLRASMRPPFAKTHPVESIVPAIVAGFERRAARLFLPGFVRVARRVRNTANSTAALRDQLRAAPEMRALFAAQAEREGTARASFGSRWTPSS